MKDLLENILNKEFETAKSRLEEELQKIIKKKLNEKKKMIAAGLSEANVNKEGLVELPTGEKILPSVYRQRRWLAESDDKTQDKDAKIKAALERAKMLVQPQLDTTAPRVDRTKKVRPKGAHHTDNITPPDLGPNEAEWMHGKEVKK